MSEEFKNAKALDELSSVNWEAVQISIASPEDIRAWSYGEVKTTETINYRTFKPERDGLFCARIFGPIKDFECSCGKYKRLKHKGIICERCGVEVIASKVRRSRMGHIELVTPVSHIWFLRTLPTKIGTLLGMSLKNIEDVLYYNMWIVMDPGESDLEKYSVLSDEEYEEISNQAIPGFKAGIGAEAVQILLHELDLEKLRDDLREELAEEEFPLRRKKLIRKLQLVEGFIESNSRPEWMIMDVIPVIPPDLRPLVPLDGGRFATSDLNDLYRAIISRNNRLRRLMELNAPELIVRNEKRMLQESVDALFDNGRRGKSLMGSNNKPLKCLSEMIKGKQGRFRQNLLGKRVDYSGRSVITVGPHLKLHQCGVPKTMALELFKPFVLAELEKFGYANSIKSAKRIVEKKSPEVWEVLEDVIKDYPVLLNRAPTLHRLGIQAFEPILVEGNALQLHPLACTAFNADFDGDQMAIHIPLSIEAQLEARILMMSTSNILSPANGTPITVPTQDMVLGLYYMTIERSFEAGDGMTFCAPWEVIAAYSSNQVGMHAHIKVRLEDGKLYDTTPGRILVWVDLPKGLDFAFVNLILTKKNLAKLIAHCCKKLGIPKTVTLCDTLKDMGYKYSTQAGITIGIKDLIIPAAKQALVSRAEIDVKKIDDQFREGIITSNERYNKIIDVWTTVTQDVSDAMVKEISVDHVKDPVTGKVEDNLGFNPVFMMSNSGARGNQEQMRQLAGMRGLMAKPNGEIIETPITASFREGLSPLQYFISSHGARKGLTDTALKTSSSGYLTRRLVDVAQDVIISEEDCGTINGIKVSLQRQEDEDNYEQILGRILLRKVRDPDTHTTLIKAGKMLDDDDVQILKEHNIESVMIRSALTCCSKKGICAKCYGKDLAQNRMVSVGEPVGIIAAQSIGEPGTQLTLRTFHLGGAASKKLERSSIEAQTNGTVVFTHLKFLTNSDGEKLVLGKRGQLSIVDDKGKEKEHYVLEHGSQLLVEEDQEVTVGTILAKWDIFNETFISEANGYVEFSDMISCKSYQTDIDVVTNQRTLVITNVVDYKPAIAIVDENGKPKLRKSSRSPITYPLPHGTVLMVEDGDSVKIGDIFARKPRETIKTSDIVGGLPRVADLFEARKPKDPAVMAEISGTVVFNKEFRGKVKLSIVPDEGEEVKYIISKNKQLTVSDGDFVEAGNLLTNGQLDITDLLHVKGEKYLAAYLVNEVQKVYKMQGVAIDNKHMEIMVRQMLRKVTILTSGDTNFLPGEQIDKLEFTRVNSIMEKNGLEPATAEPLVLGITQASLSTASFIAAASFQETTRVLTEAAIKGKIDPLQGMKENIIIGQLIPAGTGNKEYRNSEIVINSESGAKRLNAQFE